jgi:hypothetical protein
MMRKQSRCRAVLELWAANKAKGKYFIAICGNSKSFLLCRGRATVPRRAGEDEMTYRLGADRRGFIAIETGMGKVELDWL